MLLCLLECRTWAASQILFTFPLVINDRCSFFILLCLLELWPNIFKLYLTRKRWKEERFSQWTTYYLAKLARKRRGCSLRHWYVHHCWVPKSRCYFQLPCFSKVPIVDVVRQLFFQVLKTRDYIHVEQPKPFDNISIKPRIKLMKSDFWTLT